MTIPISPLQTGQSLCYDASGMEIPCKNTGQDGETRYGLPWPAPRFRSAGATVLDCLTGLEWTKNANLSEFPLTWQEALDFIRGMNEKKAFGHDDWRLPNRRELHSLMSYEAKKPSLPQRHPFENYFLGWYWTSTTAAINPAYAWYVHLEGARMFYGRKDQYYLFWPVRRNGNNVLPHTGQAGCYDMQGNEIRCNGSGQDGEYRQGASWPQSRFEERQEVVYDKLTGLFWCKKADIANEPLSWPQALLAVEELNHRKPGGIIRWSLPNINALESLVDCSQHSPALPSGHPFTDIREGYWSSTTSYFETDWAWALYLRKGALGVGHKKKGSFFVWPVGYNGAAPERKP